MDCSPPGSPVHGILQARILEWVGCSLLQGIFPAQGSNLGLLNCRQILYHLSHQGNDLKTHTEKDQDRQKSRGTDGVMGQHLAPDHVCTALCSSQIPLPESSLGRLGGGCGHSRLQPISLSVIRPPQTGSERTTPRPPHPRQPDSFQTLFL